MSPQVAFKEGEEEPEMSSNAVLLYRASNRTRGPQTSAALRPTVEDGVKENSFFTQVMTHPYYR